MKILIPGGHITPALAVAELLREKGCEVVFVGRTIEAGGMSLEAKLIQKSGFRTIPISAGRITRTLTFSALLNILLVPIGFIQALFIIISENPSVILSFGGYIALPLVIWGYIFGKKIYTHEQTMIPGLANKVIAFFSQKIFVTFEPTKRYFDRKKVIVTGNPMRKELQQKGEKPAWLPSHESLPILLIMGGALGSHSINVLIESILPQVCMRFTVVHQTGNVAQYQDFKRLSSLPQPNYYVREHLSTNEVAYFFHTAAIVISRAGANTVLELCVARIPSILIPLPYSSGGEQEAQARWMEEMGVSKKFEQHEDPQELLAMIDTVYQYREDMKEQFKNIHHIKDAEESIVKEVCQHLEK